MKCLILAGGRGERLWPLSRKNYPKQFIEIQKNHSVFQETVARNIPYCDEFIIVTNYEYRNIITNQMKAFQGTSYRCIFEECPRKTTAAILLACLSLQPSEYIFVVAADHLIDTKTETNGSLLSYKDAILRAKTYAKESGLALFGLPEQEPDGRFGYMHGVDADGFIKAFFEKPDDDKIQRLRSEGNSYRNLCMMLFQNGTLKNELRTYAPKVFGQCEEAYKQRKTVGGDTVYPEKVLAGIEAIAIEKSLIEKSPKIRAVPIGFGWNDIGNLEDLGKTDVQSEGVSVAWKCNNAVTINRSPRQALLVNELDDVLVVNTPDAVYVGKYGSSHNLKEILHTCDDLGPYTQKSTIYYRPWGMYERYVEEPDYWVQKITLLPGKTIYQHKHMRRTENWMVIRGEIQVLLDGNAQVYHSGENIDIPAGSLHQVSNIGSKPALILETAIGEILQVTDLVSQTVPDLAETQLGFDVEPMVKLRPAFKDYLWGGTKLRERYAKDCDFDVIAESWELSAHPDGPSIVASGRHSGMRFSKYLATVGKEVLGWKCDPLQSFPLLVKFIDAKDNLSVQVHPDDDYALERENQYGKNEMWYVVDAEPGAGLYVGFNRDVTREEVEQRVKNNTIMDVLNFYPTKPGDVFFIPAGTVHAIGAGNLICEIQQSSNCTYRLYDFDRRDKFGNPRQLHLEKALDVLSFEKYVQKDFQSGSDHTGRTLCRCKYFESVIYKIAGTEKIQLQKDRFNSIICVSGSGSLRVGDTCMSIAAGECFFIPASEKMLTITGSLSVILSYI